MTETEKRARAWQMDIRHESRRSPLASPVAFRHLALAWWMQLPLRMKPITLVSMFVGMFFLGACGPGFASSAPFQRMQDSAQERRDQAAEERQMLRDR